MLSWNVDEWKTLTLVHISAEREHLWWDINIGILISATETVQVELRSGRV
jgi:hypothetical protein